MQRTHRRCSLAPSIERVCDCGRVFKTYASQMKQHCSRACSSRFIPRKPRRGLTRPCAVCSAPVYANATQQAVGQGVYCSRACQTLAQTKPAVVKLCPVCGTEMRLKPSQAARVYCSHACEKTTRIRRPLEREHNGRPARLSATGYVMVWEPEHPGAFHGWVAEHRLVAESVIGRFLTRAEAVHHVNGVKDDNRPDNLEVMDALAHATLSVGDYRDTINRQLAELAEYRRRFGPLPVEE